MLRRLAARTPVPRAPWGVALVAVLALVPSAVVRGAPPDPPPEEADERGWRVLPLPLAPDGASAVAAGAGRQAVGDARGFLIGEAGGRWRRFALRGEVRDLAFGPDGALWIASSEGLQRLLGGRLEERPPAPGEVHRSAVRVAVATGAVAVATEGGVFWSRDGRGFERVEGLLGESAAGGLALAGGSALWIAAERGLFRAALPPDGVAQRVRAERVELPVDLRPALDVRVEAGRVLALGRQALVASDGDRGAWLVHRPELPPGSLPTRLAASAAGLWIATDRGLSAAPAPEGPWRRAPDPAGTAPCFGLAADGAELLVASARGLLVGTPVAPAVAEDPPSPSAPNPPDATAVACDPPIAAVQRAALAFLDLRGERVARMWSGVRRRGFLPDLVLEGDWARDEGRRHAYDETFVSGDTRHLTDRDRFRDRDREFTVALRWQLGDVLYHDEEIDVSNEARRVIELRDDVLDEVNQLYFDRRRALEAAAATPSGSPEGARERLRAEELAAGLDAWTGGWFGAHAESEPCPRVGP